MSGPPATALPTNTAEFHNYAFSNACLRVYTIVSLKEKFKKDAPTQTEASRGLHWEMAALFDHLTACKMFGAVPIPTAVVPMLRHYTSLYEVNPNPTVDIHAFPFQYNDFMTSRIETIQGNRWWDPLLEGYVAPQIPQMQQAGQPVAGQAQTDGNPAQVAVTQEHAVPQGPEISAGTLNTLNATTMEPRSIQDVSETSTIMPTPVTNGQVTNLAPSTAANPAAPYFSINTTVPADPNIQITSSNYGHLPNGSRFIPYNPPGTVIQPPVPEAGGSVSAPVAPRAAIIAPPVKKAPSRRKSAKTSEFVDEDGGTAQGGSSSPATQQETPVDKENGVEGATASVQRKRLQDTLKESDFTKSNDGPHACANCNTHGRKCLTSKDNRLKRCYQCRLNQSRCVWPVSDGSASTMTSTFPVVPAPDATAPTISTPIPESQLDATAGTSGASTTSKASNRYVAEVVVTPVRPGKRKAPDVPGSADAASKRSMHLRSRGPLHEDEEDDSETPEDRASEAHNDNMYLRSKMELLVDMARTAEMRLADVLGRVSELEVANQRMEKMIAALGGVPPTSNSPKRKQ